MTDEEFVASNEKDFDAMWHRACAEAAIQVRSEQVQQCRGPDGELIPWEAEVLALRRYSQLVQQRLQDRERDIVSLLRKEVSSFSLIGKT